RLGAAMLDPVRQEVTTAAHTVVIKVGTNVLTGDDGSLAPERFAALAQQLAALRAMGKRVVLVSSGAIGAGVGRLALGKRPSDLRQLQACASIGQPFLMRAWETAFGPHQIPTAQLLLTAADFDSRTRYLNIRNTLSTLFEYGCLPIVNENDTVSVAEIQFGDNDHLAALVTNLLQAPLLIILSVVDGLFTADPTTDPNAQPIATVEQIDAEVMGRAGSTRSALGTGGMRSKLRAARLVTVAGESVILASGRRPEVLSAIFRSERVGTLFLPHATTLPAWKRWVGYTARPKGWLMVDAGARTALVEKGKSLLPIGIVQVSGSFSKGDVVEIRDAQGIEFARGLTNYPAATVDKLRGLRSDQMREILGSVPYAEIIHRDNLVIIK
ncbi:MAG: glutamate 5-kinase, partial [Gemmataceae bacterium]